MEEAAGPPFTPGSGAGLRCKLNEHPICFHGHYGLRNNLKGNVGRRRGGPHMPQQAWRWRSLCPTFDIAFLAPHGCLLKGEFNSFQVDP